MFPSILQDPESREVFNVQLVKTTCLKAKYTNSRLQTNTKTTVYLSNGINSTVTVSFIWKIFEYGLFVATAKGLHKINSKKIK